MAKNEKKTQIAERLYIESGYTAKAIAETLGTTEKTIGLWKEKYKWEEKKTRYTTAPHKLQLLLLEEMENIANGKEPTFNADAFSKLMKGYKELDKSTNTQTTISVIKEFDKWLLTEDIDRVFLENSLILHKRFIQYKIENEE